MHHSSNKFVKCVSDEPEATVCCTGDATVPHTTVVKLHYKTPTVVYKALRVCTRTRSDGACQQYKDDLMSVHALCDQYEDMSDSPA
jgi:hypothetical protein